MPILAHHIVWTTYGTWLPGDERGWIDNGIRGIQPPNPEREAGARQCLAQSPIELTHAQRAIVQRTIEDHCRIRGWPLHALNVRSNHIHVVVSSKQAAEEVMKQLKAWCSRRLSDSAGLNEPVAKRAGRRRWFTEGGNCNAIEDAEYLKNAIRYVIEGQ